MRRKTVSAYPVNVSMNSGMATVVYGHCLAWATAWLRCTCGHGVPGVWCTGPCTETGVPGHAQRLVYRAIPQDWCTGPCLKTGVPSLKTGVPSPETGVPSPGTGVPSPGVMYPSWRHVPVLASCTRPCSRLTSLLTHY